MIGVDTNILIRYITQDDAEQSSVVNSLMEFYAGHEQSIFISSIVICEVVWVLKHAYKYSKPQILQVLNTILATPEFCYEDFVALRLSITDYKNSSADLSDILIGYIGKKYGCDHTISFDKEALNLPIFQLPPF